MNTQSQTSLRARLSKALTWSLLTIIRLLVVLILLLALAAAIQFGIQQIYRSIGNVNDRADRLDSDVGNLMENDTAQRQLIAGLRDEIGALGRQQAALAEELAAAQSELADQSEQVVEVEAQAADLTASRDTLVQDVSDLASGLVALQNDANENGGRIDELGGQLDALQAGTAALESEIGQLAESVAEPREELERLQQALALFRVWELVARARLRLAENNPGLAVIDVERAQAGADVLAANSAQQAVESVQVVQTRLGLVVGSLPDDPVAAARDLEAAWEEIDRLLAALVLPETAPPALAPTEAATAEAESAAPTQTPEP